MWYIKFFVLILSASGSLLVMPKSNAEYKEQVTRLIMKCTKEHPVEMSELFNLEKYVVPKNKETRCLLACAYKSQGAMTKDGLYDVKHALKVTESMSNGDEAKKKNGALLVETCSKVNEKPVSDGEKGCDRAALIFKCLTEKGPKLGFNA